METTTEEIPEKRRVSKAALIASFCILIDRYNTTGISSVLFLFFNQKIGYDANESTVAYHTFEFLLFFFPIVGAIIADSWLGRYRTIIGMSIVVAVGGIIVTVGVTDSLNLPIKWLSIVGLLMLAFGDGCLFTLFLTFGAEQYKSTEVKSIDYFFVLTYFMIKSGSLISLFISPILREDVKCFGNDDCFPLVFGLPAVLMLVVTVLIIIANRYRESTQVKGTTLLNVLDCMMHAIYKKFKSMKLTKSQSTQHHHWLDYSKEKYGNELVADTHVILKVFVLYIPLTIFWALSNQQGSRWVFQATKMNGDLGFYTVKADQFVVINPILVVCLIPVFEHVLYSLLAKVGIKTALRNATLGGVLAGVSFIFSAIVELRIETDRLHMTWLIPQYLVMAMGEVLIVIPLLNFSYTQAPKTMKSILQALFLLCSGVGNLIVVFIAKTKIVESQFYGFILFAVLMFVDMIVFGCLARRYKSSEENYDENSSKTVTADHRVPIGKFTQKTISSGLVRGKTSIFR